MSEEITVSLKEQKIIRTLERLAKDWPRNLMLFSGAGILYLVRVENDDLYLLHGGFNSIVNDSGDPFILNKDLDIEYA